MKPESLPWDAFRQRVMDRRLSALFGMPTPSQGLNLVAVVSSPLEVLTTRVEGSYPALTPEWPQAHYFERELYEQWGIQPLGHPWLKPIRFLNGGVGVTDFFQVKGKAVHEVAVGPVHAGVIEPGHFRFQCHGEEVLHLEISLGYQHRGVERALPGASPVRALTYVETLAGDTSIGHALAYCLNMERLAGAQAPPRAEALRIVALELERLANHCGDLGAMAGDVGYLPAASYCGRLRGDLLNLTALACGSRFGRGWIRPGGVAYDLEPERVEHLRTRLNRAMLDAREAVHLLRRSASVQTRFEGVGALNQKTARALGLVGPPARATGLQQDCRLEFPWGPYATAPFSISTETEGDVLARSHVRWLEMKVSAAIVNQILSDLPQGPLRVPLAGLTPEEFSVSLIEGWRGEICHVAATDEQGRLVAYKVVDPSFHNWFGLAVAMRGQQISDFPLCNKSFNLSYCGHDL